MSVILESQPGDEIVCIQEFNASPMGMPFSWSTCHTFVVGEKVRFQGFHLDPNFRDQPNGWMVEMQIVGDQVSNPAVPLDPSSVVKYCGTQSYFVTEEVWERIKEHFATNIVTSGTY